MKRLLLLFAFCACYAQAPHAVTLSWMWAQGDGPAADGFHVYRATLSSGPFTSIATVPNGTFTYVDTSSPIQNVGAQFYYRVTSYNSIGESVPSNTVRVTIPNNLSPATTLAATAK